MHLMMDFVWHGAHPPKRVKIIASELIELMRMSYMQQKLGDMHIRNDLDI
jgi:hypothetical protein